MGWGGWVEEYHGLCIRDLRYNAALSWTIESWTCFIGAQVAQLGRKIVGI